MGDASREPRNGGGGRGWETLVMTGQGVVAVVAAAVTYLVVTWIL